MENNLYVVLEICADRSNIRDRVAFRVDRLYSEMLRREGAVWELHNALPDDIRPRMPSTTPRRLYNFTRFRGYLQSNEECSGNINEMSTDITQFIAVVAGRKFRRTKI